MAETGLTWSAATFKEYAILRAWYGSRPRTGSMAIRTIFSGVCSATSSMSMPPASLAITTTPPADPSMTIPTYSSRSTSKSLLDENRANGDTLRAGLVRDEVRANQLTGGGAGLFRPRNELDATRLAASTRVNLRLDHNGPA